MRVYLSNVGCKLNQAEVEALGRAFAASGHEVVASLQAAEVHVVNSCTVTGRAARDSRKTARRGRAANPGMRTVLTGCHATYDPSEASRLDGVDLVVGNREKERLVELVEEALPGLSPPALVMSAVPRPRTRVAVKIQDGCPMHCAFCVIPMTRGASSSRPLAEVVAEVRRLVAVGAPEVVLTGVQISSYRHDGRRLADVVRAVLAETAVPRLRLSSLAPWEVEGELLGLWSDRRLCRHLHMSLQSGCTATLRRMRRPYTASEYAGALARVRAAVPGVAVTTDVIVGFPGETDDEFSASLAFVAAAGFARVHVFPFSPRRGTRAAGMDDRVEDEVKRTRMAAMLEAARAAEQRFQAAHVGIDAEVLWEERRGRRWVGLTDTYLRVALVSREDLGGEATRVRLAAVDAGILVAEALEA
jgi:threonylcarbamoyladenosine tRNA methylthiotransferase MtaB